MIYKYCTRTTHTDHRHWNVIRYSLERFSCVATSTCELMWMKMPNKNKLNVTFISREGAIECLKSRNTFSRVNVEGYTLSYCVCVRFITKCALDFWYLIGSSDRVVSINQTFAKYNLNVTWSEEAIISSPQRSIVRRNENTNLHQNSPICITFTMRNNFMYWIVINWRRAHRLARIHKRNP